MTPAPAQSAQIFELDYFNPDELAQTVTNADIEIEQMKPGPFQAKLTAMPLPQSELMVGQLNQSYRLKGSYPKDVSLFSFWLPGTEAMSVRGVDFDPLNTLTFGQNGAETEMLGHNFNHYGTFAIAQSRFLELAESVYELNPDIINAEVLIFDGCQTGLNRLRQTVKEIHQCAMDSRHFGLSPHLIHDAESKLTEAFLQILQDQGNQNQRTITPTAKHRRKILRKVNEYIHLHSCDSCSLSQLCQIAGTSKRALQYAFQEAYDMTPMTYLKIHRLNQARRELLQSQPELTSVTDIAYRYGCSHLGRFASEYAKHFGEKPSETLKTKQ